MKNWKVLQKKISEMSKDAFITFAKEKLYCDTVRYILGVNVECGRCKYRYESRYESGNADCKKVLLEEEYQPPKQEKWIVHRTLRRKKGIETYVSLDREGYRLRNYDTPFNHYELYSHTDRKQAKGFSREEAIHIRDILNEKRVGKRYLWVISKVEE